MDAWRAMVRAQGGDPDAPLPAARETEVVRAERRRRASASVDAYAIGVAAWRLGAGRARKEDPVSAAAGVVLHKRPGDPVRAGELLSSCVPTTRPGCRRRPRRPPVRCGCRPSRRRRRRWSSTGSAESRATGDRSTDGGRPAWCRSQQNAILPGQGDRTADRRVSKTGNPIVLVAAPDPRAVREASLDELSPARVCRCRRPGFPWSGSRATRSNCGPPCEIEARVAVLHVVVARCFGMPAQTAMSWLLDSHLVDMVTPPEWQFVVGGKGDHRSFVLHHDAVFSLAWVLGLSRQLDPTVAGGRAAGGADAVPAGGETFGQWRARILAAPRDPAEAAALLDLHYCLDWAYLEAEKSGQRLPGLVDANAIGQRRWALEWAVMLRGPVPRRAAGLGRGRPLHLSRRRALVARRPVGPPVTSWSTGSPRAR